MKQTMLLLVTGMLFLTVSAQTKEVKKPVSVSTTKKVVKDSTRVVKPASLGGSLFVKSYRAYANVAGYSTDGWQYPNIPGINFKFITGLNPHIDFVSTLGGSLSEYKKSNASFYFEKNDRSTLKPMVDFDVLFNFKFNTDKKRLVPYITAGLGGSVYNLNLVLPYGPILGGGLQLNAGKGLFFYSQLIARNGVEDKAKPNFDFSIGVTWALKKKKEIKKIEQVTRIAAPIALDKDSDGIVDSLDKCPSVAGIKKYLGCPIPDSDNDGVNDDDDSCKLVSGLIRYHGCPIPDTDKDGLNDEDDSCKLVAGTLKYHGCPIPDTDKDGVNDEEDACPNEAGIPVNKGCPEIQAKMNELAKNVYFSVGSSVISPKSFPILEEVAALMQRYPKFRIEIEGHTDNVGNPLINKKMSQKRADALKTFFISKGIDANRLYAIGYGLEKPVSTNKTPAGRALNRRVELKAKY